MKIELCFDKISFYLFIVTFFVFFWGDVVIWVGLTCFNYYFIFFEEVEENKRVIYSLIGGSIQNFFLCFSLMFIFCFFVYVICRCINNKEIIIADDDSENSE